MVNLKLAPILLISLATDSFGFVKRQHASRFPLTRVFGGGANDRESLVKTYDTQAVRPMKDLIDMESAMREFFSSKEEWKPLFRSIAEGPSSPAMSFIDGTDISNFEFHETTSPWKRLEAIPTEDADRDVLATFLDSVQASLLDIPVDETTEDDELDLHFLEEGRRMLVCSRFHVVMGTEKGSIDSFDSLFAACWNEIMHLGEADEADTGSLIVVPGSDIEDLRRFTDMNLQRPLQWLGIDSNFEVATMRKGLSAIRLIHKLSDIPTDIAEGPEEEDEQESTGDE
jgi:hypothetical protein